MFHAVLKKAWPTWKVSQRRCGSTLKSARRGKWSPYGVWKWGDYIMLYPQNLLFRETGDKAIRFGGTLLSDNSIFLWILQTQMALPNMFLSSLLTGWKGSWWFGINALLITNFQDIAHMKQIWLQWKNIGWYSWDLPAAHGNKPTNLSSVIGTSLDMMGYITNKYQQMIYNQSKYHMVITNPNIMM
jgi:hypothetical protein